MSRWLVTGASGMLGRDLVEALGAAGEQVTPAGHDVLDVTDAVRCESAVAGHDIVVNCAAWTRVDDAEAHEAEAFAVNAVGAANLARASTVAGAVLVQVSTDYVFAGDASEPYGEDAAVAPRSAYGRTKAAGEWAVRALCPASYVVRTAWVYGRHGPNFVATMARLATERDTVDVVDDQRGQPTWSHDLAGRIHALVTAGAAFGTYHATSAGAVTWYGLAREVFARLGHDPERVRPTTTEHFPRPAPRPASSVLAHDRWLAAGLGPLEEWLPRLQYALERGVVSS